MPSIQAFRTRPAAVLKLTGEDHIDFLQSQGTADMHGPTGSCTYSLWLDHKGLIHADGFVLRVSDEKVLLVSYEVPAAELMEKFDRHIIADDVAVTDHTSEWQLISIPPSSAERFLADRSFPHQNNRFQIEADGYLFGGRRLGEDSIDYLVPAKTEVPLELNEISYETAEHLRIDAGIPSIPRDIPPASLNPIEANIMSPLSFTKGCYLGQEVVARVHRLKRVSTRMARFEGKGPAPRTPMDILDGERLLGRLTSVSENPDTGFLGLGWLKSRVKDGSLVSGDFKFSITTIAES